MARYKRTIYVGDSLGVGTSPYLKGVKANVRGGRPSTEGVDIVRKAKGADRIVFDLGTNDGSVNNLKGSVRQVLKAANGRPVVMGTVNSPTDQKAKNKYLKRLAAKGRITLVNTKKVELSGDGIHATGKGYKQRAKLLNQAIKGSPGSAPTRKSSPKATPDRTLLKQYLAQQPTTTSLPKKPKRDYAREARDL